MGQLFTQGNILSSACFVIFWKVVRPEAFELERKQHADKSLTVQPRVFLAISPPFL